MIFDRFINPEGTRSTAAYDPFSPYEDEHVYGDDDIEHEETDNKVDIKGKGKIANNQDPMEEEEDNLSTEYLSQVLKKIFEKLLSSQIYTRAAGNLLGLFPPICL